MRRLLKSFTAFSVIAMLLFSFCISVGAVEETHNSQDGLVASITTKKDSYESNEDIDLTFKVTNTNDFTVENVSLEAILPENFEVKDNKKQNVDYVSLKSGESITLDIVAIKVNNTATKPDNTKATATSKSNIEETTKILIPDVQAVTSATDGVSKNSVLATQNSSVKSEESVKTGNNMAVFFGCINLHSKLCSHYCIKKQKECQKIPFNSTVFQYYFRCRNSRRYFNGECCRNGTKIIYSK